MGLEKKIIPLVPSLYTMFLLFMPTPSLWHNLLSCLLFPMQLFNEKLRSVKSFQHVINPIIFSDNYLLTLWHWRKLREWCKLFLFELWNNLVKSITKFHLCCPDFSSRVHWPFPHHVSLTMASFSPVSLPNVICSESSLTHQTNEYLNNPLFSSLALHFPL